MPVEKIQVCSPHHPLSKVLTTGHCGPGHRLQEPHLGHLALGMRKAWGGPAQSPLTPSSLSAEPSWGAKWDA